MKPAGCKKQRFGQMRGQPPKVIRPQLPQCQEHHGQIRRFEKVNFLSVRTEPGRKAIPERIRLVEHLVEERDARLHLQVVGGGTVSGEVLIVEQSPFTGQ
jgi:hypothetical protein